MIPNIGLFDVSLGVIYLTLIYFFAIKWKKYKVIVQKEYNWYLHALTAKMVGSVTFIIISIFYYKKGDTFLYFQIAEDLRSYLFVEPLETIKILFTSYSDLDSLAYNPLGKYNYYYERSGNWFFGRLVFCFNLLGGFGSYVATSLLMSTISFLGLWLGYLNLIKVYNKASKLLLVPFFCIPTVLLWSSGILKETIIVGLLGFIIWSVIGLINFKTNFFINIIVLISSVLLLLFLKPILFIVLTPFIGLWMMLHYSRLIKRQINRVAFRLSCIVLVITFFTINFLLFDNTSKYYFANLLTTLKGFHNYHTMAGYSLGESVYTLGYFEYNWQGVVAKIPSAIEATFLRPYLWEIKNVPMLLASLESVFFIIVLIVAVFKIKKNIGGFYVKYEVLIFMIFSLLYGAVVGVSAYNFGALSRYKIPALMFMYIAVAILYKPNQPLKNLVTRK